MFPFERVIGSLQKTNTNHKIGQLEQTMLGAFCAAARVKVLLQHPNAPKVVRDASNMLKVCCSASDDGTLAADISVFHMLTQTDETNWTINGDAKVEEAPALVKRALVAAGIEGHLDDQLDMFSRCMVSGIKYGTQEATRTNCNIFFDESGGRLMPGVIEYIFAIRPANGKPKYFVVTRRNLPVPNLMTDLFKAYKDFGAGLWKDEHATELDIISLTEGTFCHAISMPWLDGILVMKPLNRAVRAPDS
ncbi:hypothetical protein BDN67DRAFT_1017217 [Paxillus ammoniavirescens]|nr:hypothetical protein BDN67DRAFT_1017217 [Paxillus ammoniavirescens]